jgi:hypothetical protein
MARKVVNRKELRREYDEAEKTQAAVKPAKAAATTTKRKSRAKTPKEIRLRASWVVFNQSMKRVAVFEYSRRDEAEKKAKELEASQKTPHFIQCVKEEIKD